MVLEIVSLNITFTVYHLTLPTTDEGPEKKPQSVRMQDLYVGLQLVPKFFNIFKKENIE